MSMNPQFGDLLHIGGYHMAMCCEPLGDQFAQAFRGRGGRPHGYQGTWEIREGRLYLIALVGTLKDGEQANLVTFFPNSPDGVFADWYSGPLIEPEGTQRKYIVGPSCTYDCDLFVNVDKGLAEAYLCRAGGPKDYKGANERYGLAVHDQAP